VIVPATATAQPIPTPPDFPVSFAPGEERLLWDRDRTHFPQQVTRVERGATAWEGQPSAGTATGS
jgi:hypothetical protein